MNNKRATKRALLTSVMALVMCVVMLAGTTFAWFTDTASTGVNKIQAGNLDVALEYAIEWDTEGKVTKWENAEGKTLQFKTADGRTDNILWEPGCRYQLPELRVVNNGNLALKYIIKVTGIETNHEVVPGEPNLKDVITWEIKYSNDAVWHNEADTFKAGYSLAPNASNVVTIKGVMDKNAGNEYQGLSIDGVSVTVYATQMTAEFDSIDNLYDKDAQYPTDADALNKALAGGGTVVVGSDIVAGSTRTAASDRLVIEKPTTLNLSAKIKTAGELFESDNFCAMFVQADTTINATENGGIVCEAATGEDGEYSTYAINVKNGATLTINGGTYYGGGTAVQVQEGKLIINGGHFEVIPFSAPYGYDYMLNCIDSAYKNGTASIEVKGGTFVNFDPSNCKAEGAGTNFVATGYKVVSEAHGTDTWYTVVPNTVSGQEELNNAINNATGTVGVQLPAGTYTLPTMTGKDVTIIGTKDTVIDVSTGAAHHGATIALEGVTVKGQTSGNFEGLMHTKKVTYKDCTITGKQTLYANDVEFINCTFDSGADYAIWTYGAKNVTFTDCKFNSTNNQKSVLCYSVLKDQTFTRTFNNCTFTSTGTGDKSAIMINPTESGGGTNTYIVNINNCTATGYSESGISGQTIVGLRNAGAGVIDTITVNINGTNVYTHNA